MRSNAPALYFPRLVASLVVQSDQGLVDEQVEDFIELRSAFNADNWEGTLEEAQNLARDIEALQGGYTF